MISADNIFYTLASHLSIGEDVELKKARSFSMVQGELRQLYTTGDTCFVTIYSYYKRKVFDFRVNENFELESLAKGNDVESDELIYYELKGENPRKKKFKKIIGKILLILVVLGSIASYLPEINFEMPRYSYNEFLQKELDINRLFNVTTARLSYRFESGEMWLKPEEAWNKRKGDCEEFASICADYLTRHNIQNYIVGLYMKGDAIGHAVVFLKHQDNWHIMDLNKTIETNGLRKIIGAATLREAVAYYKPMEAFIYGVPRYNGEKNLLFIQRFPENY